MQASEFKPLNIALLTISDTRTIETDTSGSQLQTMILETGHKVIARQIVTDDRYHLRAQVSQWIANPQVQVIITSGGTGVTGRDITPEALEVLFDKKIEGFGEVFRYLSIADVGMSTLQSRCIAGVANATYIFCLPGSTNACTLAWQKILAPQLDARTKPCNFANLVSRLLE